MTYGRTSDNGHDSRGASRERPRGQVGRRAEFRGPAYSPSCRPAVGPPHCQQIDKKVVSDSPRVITSDDRRVQHGMGGPWVQRPACPGRDWRPGPFCADSQGKWGPTWPDPSLTFKEKRGGCYVPAPCERVKDASQGRAKTSRPVCRRLRSPVCPAAPSDSGGLEHRASGLTLASGLYPQRPRRKDASDAARSPSGKTTCKPMPHLGGGAEGPAVTASARRGPPPALRPSSRLQKTWFSRGAPDSEISAAPGTTLLPKPEQGGFRNGHSVCLVSFFVTGRATDPTHA